LTHVDAKTHPTLGWSQVNGRFARSLSALLLTLALACANAQTPLRTVKWPELNSQVSFDMAAARAWSLPVDVSFEIDGGPVIEDDRVCLSAWLMNASRDPQLVIIFPVGTQGFIVRAVSGIARSRPGPLPPPPAPPPPLVVTLPAQSRFHLETNFSISDFEWDMSKPREIEWSFLFWNEPKPRGRLLLP
jgi:hypothetical protein